MSKTITRRVVVGVSLAAVSAFGLSAIGAGGAAAGNIPGTTVTKKLVDGTPVKVELFGQKVSRVHSVVESFNTTREAWVSGKVRVTVGGKAEGGTIAAGYIVGCQVAVGIDGGGNAGATYKPPSTETSGGDLTGIDLTTGDAIYNPTTGPGVTPNADASASLSLGPGQTGYIPIIELADDDDDAVNSYTFKGRKGGVAYSQERLNLEKCAGFAEAKAKVTVVVDTESVKGVVGVYGRPFSLG